MKIKNTIVFFTIILSLLSCNSSESINSKAESFDISGDWDIFIAKSTGEENYAYAYIEHNPTESTEFTGDFIYLGSNLGFITGDVRTGDFRIQGDDIATFIDVSGRFTQNSYSGRYTAYSDYEAIKWGTLTMSRYIDTDTPPDAYPDPGIAPISVSIEPNELSVQRNQTTTFTAVVENAENTTVTWASTCGTISNEGVYTSPNAETICEVSATSIEDTSKSATAKVTVLGLQVEVMPREVALETGQMQNLTVKVQGDDDKGVTWEVSGGKLEPNGGSATFTAPSTPGVYTVTAVSQADSSKKAAAKIIVKSMDRPVNWSTLPDWFTYQANESHTGYVPVTLNPDKFIERWKVDLQHSLSPVADGEEQVYVSASNGELYALDVDKGATVWTKKLTVDSLHPPAIANERVYVTTGGHENTYLWSFDEQDGTPLSRSPFNNQWSSYYAPTPFEGNVYISGGSYGGAYAFNGDSGDELWFKGLNQYDEWTPAVDDDYVYAYTGSYTPQLTVINRQSGEAEYIIEDPNFDWSGWSMNLAPVKGANNNIVAIHNGRLLSFDLTKRAIGWELASNYSHQPSISKGVIYAINGGNVQARDEASGDLLWQWIPTEGDVSGTMVVTDNLLFVGVNSKTVAIDLSTKKAVWDYPLQGQLALSNEGLLYISTHAGELIAVDVR